MYQSFLANDLSRNGTNSFTLSSEGTVGRAEGNASQQSRMVWPHVWADISVAFSYQLFWLECSRVLSMQGNNNFYIHAVRGRSKQAI